MWRVKTWLMRAAQLAIPSRGPPAGTRPRSHRLNLEALGERITPVVGAYSPAPIARTGTGFDGVVAIFAPGNPLPSTGSLLSTGRHILTAAHVVDDNGDGKVDSGTFKVVFTTASGTYNYTVSAANVVLAPGWNGNYLNGKDLALLTLTEIAPRDADRYQANYVPDEVGKDFVVAGYGMVGTGNVGQQPNDAKVRTYGHNIFDAAGQVADYGGPLKKRVGVFGTLAYDFDNGSKSNALGRVYYPDEGFAAPGDSGGPLFTDTALLTKKPTWIAGVTSYSVGNNYNDIDHTHNSSFGEVGFATRVSDFSGWIGYQTGLGKYTMVVDMAKQPDGGNGRPDTIDVRVAGAYVEAYVNGELVQREGFSHLSGIKILGSNDPEAVTVDAAVRLPVTVDGRGGPDTLYVDDTGNTSQATTRFQGNRLTITSPGIARILDLQVNPVGLSALTVYSGTSSSGGNTVYVDDTPADPAGFTSVTLFSGGGSDATYVRRVSSPLSILGQGGQDTVIFGLNNSLNGIRNSVGVTNDADGGSTQINLWAGSDGTSRNVVMDTSPDFGNYITGLAPAPILYGTRGIRGVELISGAAADTFDVRYAQAPTHIQSGPGNDVVTIGSTNKDVPLTLNLGTGQNQVTVGSEQYGMGGIQGPLDLRARNGTNTVVLDDRGETFATKNTLTGSSFQREGSGPITFGDVYSLIINGGHGNPTGWFTPPGNTYDVLGTPPKSRLGASYTSIFTGEGRDTVNVRATTGDLYVDFQQGDLESLTVGGPERGLDPIQGPVTLTGAGGLGWNVTVDDSGTAAPQTVTIDPDGLQRSGAARFAYAGVPEFPLVYLGGNAGNTINVLGKPGNLTLLTGEGDDVVTVGTADNRLSDLGHFVINGQGGTDALYLNDQGEADARAYDVFSYEGIPVITAQGTTVVLYDMLTEAVSLNGSQGGNTVNVQNLFPTTALTLQGGAGANELTGPGGANTWTLTGPDSGTLTGDAVPGGVVQFAGFVSLLDPDGDDLFM